jgi:hypothetical protein
MVTLVTVPEDSARRSDVSTVHDMSVVELLLIVWSVDLPSEMNGTPFAPWLSSAAFVTLATSAFVESLTSTMFDV